MGGSNGKERKQSKSMVDKKNKHKDKAGKKSGDACDKKGMNDEYVRFIMKEQERREREFR